MVKTIKEKFMLPTNEDYKGAIKAIHRLEDTYLLSPSDIRSGKLSQKHPSRPLTGNLFICFAFILYHCKITTLIFNVKRNNLSVFECFEFGRIAYEENDFYHSVRWMTEALELSDKEEDSETARTQRASILDYLSYVTAKVIIQQTEYYVQSTKLWLFI